jgi:hypothetical protein
LSRNFDFALKVRAYRSVFVNKSVTALFLLGELEPYAYHTRLKIDQQKQSSSQGKIFSTGCSKFLTFEQLLTIF